MRRKTIGIILTATLIIAAVIGWCLWRQHELAKPRTIPMPPASEQTATATPQVDETARNERAQTAIRVERAMRDWGTDANIPASAYAYKNTNEALAMLHANPVSGNPLKELTDISIDEAWGPDAASRPCQLGMTGICASTPTIGQWWAKEAYAYGSRWVEEPHAELLEDGNVAVSGNVRAILLQDGDTYNAHDWYALTPAWRAYPVKDTVVFDKDGNVTAVRHYAPDYWWIDPYLRAWDNNMAASVGQGTRQVIPVKGQPHMNLDHMPSGRWLRGVENMGAMDNVDWTLWDTSKMGFCAASC